MPVYDAAVAAIDVCSDTILATLERPDGYRFAAGQWLRLTLLTAEGEQTRTLSHASAPGQDRLDICTRLSGSAFKQALAELSPGDRVTVAGPGGRLSLPEELSALVVLTGGVGVTPVRSLLLDAAEQSRDLAGAVLLFGNRNSECVPYLEDLERLQDSGLELVPVYERPPAGWSGETGFITAEMVRRWVPDLERRTFLVTGPPAMVTAMDSVMDALEVAVDRRIVERFSG